MEKSENCVLIWFDLIVLIYMESLNKTKSLFLH